MGDTRFILANLRQLLTRLDDHARAMPRTPRATDCDPGTLRDQCSFVHGMALVAVRQALLDVFEAHTPPGARDWPRHFVPLLQDFDVTSLPIDDSCAALPIRAVPASAGMAVYAGAACFIGIMSCRYAPSTTLCAEGWSDGAETGGHDGMAAAASLVPTLVGRLQTEGVLDDTATPFLELVAALATGGGIPDLVDVVAVWDRRVAAFATELTARSSASVDAAH